MLTESSDRQRCSAGDTITVSDGLSDRGFCHHSQEESSNQASLSATEELCLLPEG